MSGKSDLLSWAVFLVAAFTVLFLISEEDDL